MCSKVNEGGRDTVLSIKRRIGGRSECCDGIIGCGGQLSSVLPLQFVCFQPQRDKQAYDNFFWSVAISYEGCSSRNARSVAAHVLTTQDMRLQQPRL
jgi:hypothetical protein